MGVKKVAIVPAATGEISDIQQLFRQMFEIYHVDQDVNYPYSDSGISYLENCVDHGIALVAKDEGEIIGFLTGGIEHAMPFKTYRQHGHIHNLFILKEYRGQGIGARLIREFIQTCQENDVQRIVTDSDDIAALQRFYTSLGFRITGVNYEMDSADAD